MPRDIAAPVTRPLSFHASVSPSSRAAGLAEQLRRVVRGEVRFDAGDRALYATDASNYRQPPIGVVLPRDVEDVVRTLTVAKDARVPVFARGGGTSLAGQTCNDALLLEFSKYMNRIVEIDPQAQRARVQPGVVLDALRHAAAEHGLTFGPDPSTHQYCTLGGMIGNNSCGVHSVMAENYGPGPTTAHNVVALDIVTVDVQRVRVGATDAAEYQRMLGHGGRIAELYRQLAQFQERYADLIRREFPAIPRRVSGYNLPALLPENGFHIARALVGSESTLALTVEATVQLMKDLPHRVVVGLGYQDIYAAGDAVPDVMSHRPVGLEGFDHELTEDSQRAGLNTRYMKLLPEGRGWLLVEFGGTSPEEAADRAQALVNAVRASGHAPSVRVYNDREEQQHLWDVRESGLGATARVASRHPTWPGWEDSSVPPARLGAYLRDLRKLFDRYGYKADLYGHFGQGCVHCRVGFDLLSADGVSQFRSFMYDAADLVHHHGGSLSGEHGDGVARGELLERMFSRDMIQALREFKSIWDPEGRMNPGRVIDAYPLDEHLRLGTSYDPPRTDTWFQFPEDLGSFAHATLRCVGVGKCRKTDVGTMCPSYMVTGEEKHATRGRARLLFEMLEGNPLEARWQAEQVHEALDLCLACKGCKGECPVHVDMATYKAEFLSHYYEDHLRPRTALAFGRIDLWASLITGMGGQRIANTLAQTPVLRTVIKAAAGMAQEREVPAFAAQTFRDWFTARPPRPHGSGPRVLLWPDTFNNYFHPETLRAGVEVLETLGYEVALPPPSLCCGRPLYDFGLLSQATERLEAILTAMADEIRAGTLLVALEPGCLSVFRDELVNLFPASEQAHRLKAQTLTFAELLRRSPDRLEGIRLERRALVHGHCHHKAIVHMDADADVLSVLGIRHDVLDSGCCGMAGAFGFEADHYAVSRAIGERVLLPAVRNASAETLIVADGFSCREQIAQGTGRRAMHLAEVVHMALAEGPHGPAGDLPERVQVVDHAQARVTTRELVGAAAVLTGLAVAVTAWRR